MDEQDKNNPTVPPLPEVPNPSEETQETEEDFVNRIVGEYTSKQNRPRLASELKSTPNEFSYGKWDTDEEDYIKNDIAPNLIKDMTEDDNTVRGKFQGILDDPYETIHGSSDVGRKVRDKLLERNMSQGMKNIKSVPDFMNNVAALRNYYYIAVNSDKPESRKNAINNINHIRNRVKNFWDNLDDDDKRGIKNSMLLIEYGQAYNDITSKKVPDDQVIYIIPRETSIPLVLTVPTKGAYKTTVGDFKRDLYKLTTDRDTNEVELPSGFTMTRMNRVRTSLKDTDILDMLNPEFYRELSQEQKDRLGKEGLELFYKSNNADIVAALDRIGLRLGDYSEILNNMDASTSAIISAILASSATNKAKEAEIKRALEKAKEDAKNARKAKEKAEGERDDAILENEVSSVNESIKNDEDNIINSATDFSPINEVVKSSNGEYGDINQSVTTALNNSDRFISLVNTLPGLDNSTKQSLEEAAKQLQEDINKAGSKRSVSNPIGQKLGKEIFSYDPNKLNKANQDFQRRVEEITKGINNSQIEKKLASEAGAMMIPIAKIISMADKATELGYYHHAMGKMAKDPVYYNSFLNSLDNDYQRQLVKSKYKDKDVVPILADAALSKVPHMNAFKGTDKEKNELRKYFKEPSNEHLISIGRMGFMVNTENSTPYVGMNSDDRGRVRSGKYTPEEWLRMLGLGDWWDKDLVDKQELYNPRIGLPDKHSLDDLRYVFGGSFNWNPLSKEGLGLTYAKTYLIPFLYGDDIKNFKTAQERLKYLKAMDKRIPDEIKRIVR